MDGPFHHSCPLAYNKRGQFQFQKLSCGKTAGLGKVPTGKSPQTNPLSPRSWAQRWNQTWRHAGCHTGRHTRRYTRSHWCHHWRHTCTSFDPYREPHLSFKNHSNSAPYSAPYCRELGFTEGATLGVQTRRHTWIHSWFLVRAHSSIMPAYSISIINHHG